MAQQWFLPEVDIKVDENEIQGDILVGLQKKAEIFIFFEIVDVDKFKKGLANAIDSFAYLKATRIYEETHAGSVEKANIAFSFSGLKMLGMFTKNVPKELDKAFKATPEDNAIKLGDTISNWLPAFRSKKLHGVLLVTAWDKDRRQALALARTKADDILNVISPGLAELHREEAMVRVTVKDGQEIAGHEHFGFADGVSQPGTRGLTLPVAEKGDQSFPGQDLVEPGDFILGEKYKHSDGTFKKPPADWMENGSYLVFRRLNQDVNAFNRYVRASWSGLANDANQFAANLIGRWKDGSPIVRNVAAPESTESEDHPEKNNDFSFGLTDAQQDKCPFAAHIRRVYPRDDMADDPKTKVSLSEQRRIIRAGIAFGEDDDTDKGLLFVCYQSSIVDKFEFIQTKWANSETFPNEIERPGMQLPPKPGLDLIIGQGQSPRTQTWRTGQLPLAPTFVTATGSGYFFSPSRSGLGKICATGSPAALHSNKKLQPVKTGV